MSHQQIQNRSVEMIEQNRLSNYLGKILANGESLGPGTIMIKVSRIRLSNCDSNSASSLNLLRSMREC